ncbi:MULTISPECIES: DUF397 domain-containing protein [Actinopolyspora]|uniref:DUF397 domain-containing protein n=1 Tax=Actinopolyspora saharensis TaxID=995062 RepID=A0A1H1EZL1_9ACTN|nr:MULTISPECIES: DUF397 domain-containing protein [Actinopolyspora]NHD18291.1 DUF397 domain-containing protein [Actinopolyspora sp. BKK2]NHE77030.1 DUF397 domain-containing protein [Actinopolyspora sp. BKK1]SDQ93959.1 protein of unknown function [Actinopolyspora saharensis]
MASRLLPLTSTWCRSTRSGGAGSGSGNCVEVAFGAGFTAVRDSKSPEDGVLAVSPRAWKAFLDGLRSERYRR